MRQIIKDKKENNIIELKYFEFNSDKIYIMKYGDFLYKLHTIGKHCDIYNFIPLFNSKDVSKIVNKYAQELIEAYVNLNKKDCNIYEFDTFDEFVSWYMDNK